MGSQITPADQKKQSMVNFKKYILSKESLAQIANAVPEHINPQKMARVILTAVTKTPKLLECKPETLMSSLIECSQLGLMLDGVLGHGYLVPYGTTAVFIPGYKGLLDLARRSGEIAWVQARVVYEGDEFDYRYGMDPDLQHTPARAVGKAPGPMIASYGIAKFKDGEFHFEVMHKDEIEAIRQKSRAGQDGPWVDHFDEMARKTVIRRLCKFLPLNPEYQALVTRDEYHEAGVLGKYVDLDVDQETGEVREMATTGDMLDMFAGELESEPVIGDVPFGGKEPELEHKIEEPKDITPPGPPPAAPPAPPPEKEQVPDPEPDPESVSKIQQDGSGRISKQEEAAFAAALENLKERMRKVQDEDMISQVFARNLGTYGAESPKEIRSRLERERFYRDLIQMCEGWESMNRFPPTS